MEIKEKKVEIELNNRRYRIQAHMVEDALMLGASTLEKTIKNPPKELKLPVKPELKKEPEDTKISDPTIEEAILPKMKSEKDIIKEKLTKAGIKFHPNTGLDKLKAKLNEGNKK